MQFQVLWPRVKQPNLPIWILSLDSFRAISPYYFQADTVAEFGGWTRTLTSQIRRLSSSSTAAGPGAAAEEEEEDDGRNDTKKLQGEKVQNR